MDANVIRAITFALALLILVGYGLFVRWRIKVHRTRRDAEHERRGTSATRSADALLGHAPGSATPDASDDMHPAVAAALADEDAENDGRADRSPGPGADRSATPPERSARSSEPGGPATVLDAVAGISLPLDLVPHPDATPRAGAVDRVALVGGTVPVEVLRDGVQASLEAIGYSLVWDGEQGLARRAGTELRVDLYDAPRNAHVDDRPAFPMAPEGSVIVDFWLVEEG